MRGSSSLIIATIRARRVVPSLKSTVNLERRHGRHNSSATREIEFVCMHFELVLILGLVTLCSIHLHQLEMEDEATFMQSHWAEERGRRSGFRWSIRSCFPTPTPDPSASDRCRCARLLCSQIRQLQCTRLMDKNSCRDETKKSIYSVDTRLLLVSSPQVRGILDLVHGVFSSKKRPLERAGFCLDRQPVVTPKSCTGDVSSDRWRSVWLQSVGLSSVHKRVYIQLGQPLS